MPRITLIRRVRILRNGKASMRPGRNAPDNEGRAGVSQPDDLASMRPGRNAPDNRAARLAARISGIASMRPGRNAPDNGLRVRQHLRPERVLQ